MITTLTIASLSPFMVADAQEKVADMPQNEVAAYNWSTQNASEGVSEGDFDMNARGSFSFIPGGHGAQCVDDWYLG